MIQKFVQTALVFSAAMSAPAMAQTGMVAIPETNSGDSAWILTASALVLMMTLPGLALFYGGLVRAKNFLSVLVQCGAIAAIASVIWIVIGYSLAFSVNGNGFIGSLENVMFNGLLDSVRDGQTTGELAFALFQMTFAVITPALIVGAWVERARFGWVVAFSALWSLLVYVPVTRWVWGSGFLAEQGVIDFAGGIVVHTTAGISALVVALMLGKRIGFPRTLMLPHSPALTVAGAGLLWVGWFGFNGGSALAANDDASTAIFNTHLAACTAALVWSLIERIRIGKATSIGIVTGAVAGLATVTPAAGYIGPMGAILLGLLGGSVCFFLVQVVKHNWKIDDSLDVFGVHGIGGILGALLTGVFTAPGLGGTGKPDFSIASQVAIQAEGVIITMVVSAVVAFVAYKIVDMVVGLRVTEEEEREGLDVTSHGEKAYYM